MTTTFSWNLTPEEIKQAESQGGNTPIDAGQYKATIFEVTVLDTFSEKSDYYTGKPAFNIQYRISDGQKFANRRHFERLLIAERFAPKDGAKQGTVNLSAHKFLKAFEIDPNEFVQENGAFDKVKFITALQGRSIGLNLVVKADKYQYERALKAWADAGGEGPEPKQEDYKSNQLDYGRPYLPVEEVKAEPANANPSVAGGFGAGFGGLV